MSKTPLVWNWNGKYNLSDGDRSGHKEDRMSFSSDIKNELAVLSNESACCDVAQTYGMAEFGRSFSLSGVTWQTEHEGAATRYAQLLSTVCGVAPELARPAADKPGMYTVSVPADHSRRDSWEHSRQHSTCRYGRCCHRWHTGCSHRCWEHRIRRRR